MDWVLYRFTFSQLAYRPKKISEKQNLLRMIKIIMPAVRVFFFSYSAFGQNSRALYYNMDRVTYLCVYTEID